MPPWPSCITVCKWIQAGLLHWVCKITDSLQVYFYCSLLDDHIKNSSLPRGLKTTVKDLVKDRWNYLHSDIHSAGFALDPEFWHLEPNREMCRLRTNCP